MRMVCARVILDGAFGSLRRCHSRCSYDRGLRCRPWNATRGCVAPPSRSMKGRTHGHSLPVLRSEAQGNTVPDPLARVPALPTRSLRSYCAVYAPDAALHRALRFVHTYNAIRATLSFGRTSDSSAPLSCGPGRVPFLYSVPPSADHFLSIPLLPYISISFRIYRYIVRST